MGDGAKGSQCTDSDGSGDDDDTMKAKEGGSPTILYCPVLSCLLRRQIRSLGAERESSIVYTPIICSMLTRTPSSFFGHRPVLPCQGEVGGAGESERRGAREPPSPLGAFSFSPLSPSCVFHTRAGGAETKHARFAVNIKVREERMHAPHTQIQFSRQAFIYLRGEKERRRKSCCP